MLKRVLATLNAQQQIDCNKFAQEMEAMRQAQRATQNLQGLSGIYNTHQGSYIQLNRQRGIDTFRAKALYAILENYISEVSP